MKRRFEKKPLYRKVNTRARNVHHFFGQDYNEMRQQDRQKNFEVNNVSMKQGVRRGLDYTPLFKFLLSKVGCDWDEVHNEVVGRLDKQDPIEWMVALNEHQPHKKSLLDHNGYFLTGENSYFSTLFINDENKLALVDPYLKNENFWPACSCCTHTFNGKRFVNSYSPDRRLLEVLS